MDRVYPPAWAVPERGQHDAASRVRCLPSRDGPSPHASVPVPATTPILAPLVAPLHHRGGAALCLQMTLLATGGGSSEEIAPGLSRPPTRSSGGWMGTSRKTCPASPIVSVGSITVRDAPASAGTAA